MIREKDLNKVKYLTKVLIRGRHIFPENYEVWTKFAVDKLHDARKKQKIEKLPYSPIEVAQAMENEMFAWARARRRQFGDLNVKEVWEQYWKKFNDHAFHHSMEEVVLLKKEHKKRAKVDIETGKVIELVDERIYSEDDSAGRFMAKTVSAKKNLGVWMRGHIDKQIKRLIGGLGIVDARTEDGFEVVKMFFLRTEKDWFDYIEEEFRELPIIRRWLIVTYPSAHFFKALVLPFNIFYIDLYLEYGKDFQKRLAEQMFNMDIFISLYGKDGKDKKDALFELRYKYRKWLDRPELQNYNIEEKYKTMEKRLKAKHGEDCQDLIVAEEEERYRQTSQSRRACINILYSIDKSVKMGQEPFKLLEK